MEKNYAFETAEKEMQDFWERSGIYKFVNESGKEVYSIDTPPPTVSGSLHIGHIFSYTQAEMIARYKRMRGYNVFYPFGFDDNGLPTERLVERDEGIRARDLARSAFIEKCAGTAAGYEAEFKRLWQSLGFSVDWSLQYETVSPKVQKVSQRSFLELVKQGKAYIKESPVLWCTQCRTSIAQAELDTKDIESAYVYIPFTAEAGTLSVATTRPELLYGCVCLFVHPDDKRFSAFVGKTVRVPLYDYEIPVLADEKADPDKGTGAVMCATFGDSTDAEWALKHDLPYRKVVLPDGCLDDDVPFVGGLPVRAARKEIIRLLGEQGLLLNTEPVVHAVAVHERCGEEVEILPSRQWYIDVLSDRQHFLKAADEVNWYPPYMKNRYISWVENLKWDWCISRQRYFGVPIPVWYCKDCGSPVFAKYEQLPVNPAQTEYKGRCACGCTEFIPETAVLDTWATSSLTPLINAGYLGEGKTEKPILPMSMRTQAHEIIRTWAFYTIVKSLYHTGRIPWKDIMICGFVLAKKGEKMSKSKGNDSLSPSGLIRTHSADAMRYWSANARLGADTFFSADELSLSRRFLTKLWNAAKFAVSHLQDYDGSAVPDLLPTDRWILERTKQAVCHAEELLDIYEIGSARKEIDELFWKDFCDNYLEIVKARLYEPEIYGAAARCSGQYALYHTLLTILKMYAIYVPHITDYIYQSYYRAHEKAVSLHCLAWPQPERADEMLLFFGERLKQIIAQTRKYKSEHGMSMKESAGEVVIQSDAAHLPLFLQAQPDIAACVRASSIRYECL